MVVACPATRIRWLGAIYSIGSLYNSEEFHLGELANACSHDGVDKIEHTFEIDLLADNLPNEAPDATAVLQKVIVERLLKQASPPACQRKSPASAQTPTTDSLAALAMRPLSLAIVTKRKPERIMRAA